MKSKSLIYLIFIGIASCNYADLNPEHFNGANQAGSQNTCQEGDAGGASAPTPGVDFATVTERVFRPNCFNCHGNGSASAGVSLDSHAQASSQAERIAASVESGRMPLGGSLSQEEIDLVVEWVRLGAPNTVNTQANCDTANPQEPDPGNGDVATDPTPPDPAEPTPAPTEPLPDEELTYATVRARVFEKQCFGCHSTAGGNADGLNLETYFNTLEEIEDIEERVADNSMPPFGSLSRDDKDLVLRWIELGAPQ